MILTKNKNDPNGRKGILQKGPNNIATGYSLQNADGRLTARSREVSKPRVSGLDL